MLARAVFSPIPDFTRALEYTRSVPRSLISRIPDSHDFDRHERVLAVRVVEVEIVERFAAPEP